MKGNLILVAVAVLVIGIAYRLGFEAAEGRYRVEATLQAQKVEAAVTRATEALNHMSKSIKQDELLDDQKLKEIEDDAAAYGTRCYIPAERLLRLDTIG
jgi:hypothetical protein